VATLATVLATVSPAHAEPGGDEGEESGPRGIKPYAAQEASARLAPYGSVEPGEYGDALADLRGLPGTLAPWTEVTDKPTTPTTGTTGTRTSPTPAAAPGW
jgi:hypothetical protein